MSRLVATSVCTRPFVSCILCCSQELFYFLLLPPIIFEAGYTLRKKDFFHNILSIVMFAVLGTLVSTFIIGYLTYLAGKLVRAT